MHISIIMLLLSGLKSVILHLKQQRKLIKVQQERYYAGIANLADLSLANQEFVTASANKEQARFTLIFQEMILQYSGGDFKSRIKDFDFILYQIAQ